MVKCFKGIILSGFALSLLFAVFLNNEVYAEFNISVSTSGAQSIDILPTAGESKVTNIGTDSLTVSTTCRAGYNLTMSTSVNDNNLYLNGDSSNNASGTYFTPTDGTTTLGNSTNAWGYLMSDSAPTTSSVFLAVPTVGNAVTLKNPAGTASQTDISDSFNIYYGVSASSGLTPGSYKMIKDGSNVDGAISYYATMAESCLYSTITYDANNGTGTVADQIVPTGDSVSLSDNAFTRNHYYFKGWATTSNGSVAYRPGQVITPTDNMTLYAIWGYSISSKLYDAVASLTRGTQTVSDLNASISKANSGVYTYNKSTYGTPGDASSSKNIYYYRGILDTDLDGSSSSYGSAGDGMNYPSYVKLGTTCWRVLRTTGSGGTKLVYNGQYGATTSGSCANSTTNAQITTNAFNGASSEYRQAIRVGYTYNSSYASNSTTNRALSTLYGSDSSYSGNSSNSDIKAYLENTWFTSSTGISNYWSILEPSAGYCNDRTVYDTSNNLQAETVTIPQYSTSTTQYNFGAYVRNVAAAQNPSLSCPRSNADLYTTISASNGNKQLFRPIGLITADEATFAGSGSAYPNNPNTFLRNGTTFWMMSPHSRIAGGAACVFALGDGGNSGSGGAYVTHGVRPVISIKYETTITSGSGTATNPWVISEPYLYDKVAAMSKGTQTSAQLQEAITADNSGVYEYNSDVFGADSDGTKSDNTKATIYYYRGILDDTVGSYGSDGDANRYPNYVILQSGYSKSTTDTCWRIIRTTGSGGVKMIYNGFWTGSTCANSQTNTQLSSTSTFNGTANTAAQARQAVRVGYTHNSTYATTTSSSVAVDTLFGSDSNYSVNNANSTIKDVLESWFDSTLFEFKGAFEINSGFCNDRSAFQNTSGATATTNLYSYTTSTGTGATYRAYFGPYTRNIGTSKIPSLGCARSTADSYTVDASKSGNGQLSAPVGLITADEASFAGSGSQTASQGSGYNANSYLRSGSTFWTMSPYYRYGSYAYNFYMVAAGYMTNGRIDTAYGVRPVVSLRSTTTTSSGTGTATNPWVVRAPSKNDIHSLTYLQEFTSSNKRSVINSMTSGATYKLKDRRDNTVYRIARLADNNAWLLDNLSLDLTAVSLADLKGNTNADNTTLEYLKGSRTGTTSDKYPTAAVSKTWTSSSQNSYSTPMIAVDSSTSGTCNDAYCVNDPSSRSWSSTSVTQATINGVTSTAQGRIGVYYNYCAASAGSYCWGNGTSASGSPSSDPVSGSTYRDITADICPSGWALPAAKASQGYAGLYTAYNQELQEPLSTPFSGYFYSGKAYEQGQSGRFWSSTWYSSNMMSFLYVHANGEGPSSASDRLYGHSVRCMVAY